VVALPVFLTEMLGWSSVYVGGFMAVWVIGYGVVQASAPVLLRLRQAAPNAKKALIWAIILMLIPVVIILFLAQDWQPEVVVVSGLLIFAVVFAINSALHSYLILAYSSHDQIALKVGFYYMANAGGRLLGTVLSGWGYQQFGLTGCLWLSAGFIAMAALLSSRLPMGQISDLR